MVYTMYMSGIYHVYTILSCLQHLKDEYAFLKFSGVYIAFYTPMSWVPSNRIRKTKTKAQFNIQCICMVYTMYIPDYVIYMVYVWYIPYIYHIKYLSGVPDVKHDIVITDIVYYTISCNTRYRSHLH